MAMDIWPEDPRTAHLTLDRTEGLVYRSLPDGRLECLGPVMDTNLAPFELTDEWAELYLWWLEAGDYGRACEAEVHRSYYERLGTPNWN